MRKVFCGFLALVLAVPAFAIDGSGAVYTSGTVAQLKDGIAGTLDLTSATELRFVYAGGSLAIAYDSIESYEHSQEVAVHLGVAPAIVVGLVAHRRRNHFVRISFTDANHLHQVVVFEVPKKTPTLLMPVLEARSPQARCKPFAECTMPPSVVSRGPKNAAIIKDGQKK